MIQEDSNKELVMIKKNNQDLKNWTKCWISDNVYVADNVQVRDHCHFTGKCRDSPLRDCNIKVKLDH